MQNLKSIAKEDTLSARHIKTSNSQRKQTSCPYLHIYLDNIYYLGKHIAYRTDMEKKNKINNFLAPLRSLQEK